MAKGPLPPAPQRRTADAPADPIHARRRALYRQLGFFAGAALCLIVLTPVAKLFTGGLSSQETVIVLIGVTACALLWLERRTYSRCPICRRGILKAEDVGTIQQKLGIIDHPLFRKNVWTQWYRCSQCGYREWTERAEGT
ncbi:MAG: hypothetical protein R3229_16505 [Alphaproteobacteria bacterium]|nr:hypothetical protein [Alphaproteobacteria bacterium]